MLKLIGAVIVICSCAGLINTWRSNHKSRIRELEQLGGLYRDARSAMEEERLSVPEFVRRCLGSGDELEAAVRQQLSALEQLLEERRFGTGEESWEQACQKTKALWHLTREERELLERSGAAFFGRNLAENTQRLLLYERRAESLCKRAEQEYREKNKVWTPVGMLLGVMLIIILL